MEHIDWPTAIAGIAAGIAALVAWVRKYLRIERREGRADDNDERQDRRHEKAETTVDDVYAKAILQLQQDVEESRKDRQELRQTLIECQTQHGECNRQLDALKIRIEQLDVLKVRIEQLEKK